MSIQYRPEIDGLRAIAVVPVILFHAGFTLFSGGYVGVDIFFVISGYLITSIIYADYDRGDFSITRFYERRARRILPALFLVMITCVPFAWLWMLPHEFIKFCQSIIGVSTFTSNIYFWMDSGYFSSANETKPLLHTWSLAVEEQFYIILPPLLLLCWRLKKLSVQLIISLITIISLLGAQYASFNYPDANFYLLPTRAWELGIGVLIALYFRDNKRPTFNKTTYELGAWSGIGLILYSVFQFDGSTPFPSLYSLAPVVGTAMVIIFTTSQNSVRKILSWKPIIWLGLISYSAYLWHQPVLAFARIRLNGDLSFEIIIALLALILILSWVSWRFVEMPIRYGKRTCQNQTLKIAAVSCVCFALLGTLGWTQLELFVKSPALAYVKKWKSSISPVRSKCHATKNNLIQPEDACNLGQETEKQIYVWADSHGVELSWELSKLTTSKNLGVKQLTASQCVPIPNVKSNRENHCVNYNARVFKYLKEEVPPSVVVLIARWSLYLNSSRVDTKEGCKELGAPGPRFPINWDGLDEGERRLELVKMLEKTIDGLIKAGHNVVLIHTIPEPGCDIPKKFAQLRTKHLENETDKKVYISSPYNIYKLRSEAFVKLFQYKNKKMIDVRPGEIFCNKVYPGRCLSEIEEGPLYFDTNHPNLIGAKMIATAVLEKIIEQDWLIKKAQ